MDDQENNWTNEDDFARTTGAENSQPRNRNNEDPTHSTEGPGLLLGSGAGQHGMLSPFPIQAQQSTAPVNTNVRTSLFGTDNRVSNDFLSQQSPALPVDQINMMHGVENWDSLFPTQTGTRSSNPLFDSNPQTQLFPSNAGRMMPGFREVSVQPKIPAAMRPFTDVTRYAPGPAYANTNMRSATGQPPLRVQMPEFSVGNLNTSADVSIFRSMDPEMDRLLSQPIPFPEDPFFSSGAPVVGNKRPLPSSFETSIPNLPNQSITQLPLFPRNTRIRYDPEVSAAQGRGAAMRGPTGIVRSTSRSLVSDRNLRTMLPAVRSTMGSEFRQNTYQIGNISRSTAMNADQSSGIFGSMDNIMDDILNQPLPTLTNPSPRTDFTSSDDDFPISSLRGRARSNQPLPPPRRHLVRTDLSSSDDDLPISSLRGRAPSNRPLPPPRRRLVRTGFSSSDDNIPISRLRKTTYSNQPTDRLPRSQLFASSTRMRSAPGSSAAHASGRGTIRTQRNLTRNASRSGFSSMRDMQNTAPMHTRETDAQMLSAMRNMPIPFQRNNPAFMSDGSLAANLQGTAVASQGNDNVPERQQAVPAVRRRFWPGSAAAHETLAAVMRAQSNTRATPPASGPSTSGAVTRTSSSPIPPGDGSNSPSSISSPSLADIVPNSNPPSPDASDEEAPRPANPPGRTRKPWSPAEADLLTALMTTGRTWPEVAAYFPGRSKVAVIQKWQNMKPNQIQHFKHWSPEEDALLEQLHRRFSGKFTEIAAHIPNRSKDAAWNRWKYLVKHSMVSSSENYFVYWDEEEDKALLSLAYEHEMNWDAVSAAMPWRTSYSLRERYTNLQIQQGFQDSKLEIQWTKEEDDALRRLVQEEGSDFKDKANRIPGKSAVSMKRRWNFLNCATPERIRYTWNKEEEDLLERLARGQNICWDAIAARFPGRTKHAVKTRYHNVINKRNPFGG